MRPFLGLIVPVILASYPVFADHAPIHVVPLRNQLTDGILIMSPNKQYVAVESEQYFGSSWDTYSFDGSSLAYLDSTASGTDETQLVGLQNDGTEMRYLQEATVPFLGSHTCSLQVKPAQGSPSTLLSFDWPRSTNFANDYACPATSIAQSVAGAHLIGFEPLTVFAETPAVIGAAHYHVVKGATSRHILEIPAEDFVSVNSSSLGKSWINEQGDALVTVVGNRRSIAYLIPADQSAERTEFQQPFEVVGLDDEGFILVSRNRELFRRLGDGSLQSQGAYHVATLRPRLFENEKEGKFDVYDPYYEQRKILVRQGRDKLSDANCHLSNSYPWRIMGVLGQLESDRYLARLEKRGARARLAVVDAAELARKRSYCPVEITTEIKGDAECKRRTNHTSFGQQIVASEYEVLPNQMRCGIKVTLTDARGRRVPNFPVTLLGARYSAAGRAAIDQRHVTNKKGQVQVWLDVTTPDGSGGGNEVSDVYIASPYGDSKFRSTGVQVYYRYSHL